MAEEIRAEMVASVLRVDVAPGAPITPEVELVILESMKMEIPVHAEHAGTVSRVVVSAGDVVQEGDLLLVVE